MEKTRQKKNSSTGQTSLSAWPFNIGRKRNISQTNGHCVAIIGTSGRRTAYVVSYCFPFGNGRIFLFFVVRPRWRISFTAVGRTLSRNTASPTNVRFRSGRSTQNPLFALVRRATSFSGIAVGAKDRERARRRGKLHPRSSDRPASPSRFTARLFWDIYHPGTDRSWKTITHRLSVVRGGSALGRLCRRGRGREMIPGTSKTAGYRNLEINSSEAGRVWVGDWIGGPGGGTCL